MDDIKYIRSMHAVEGCSIREIIRRTGYHYETVRKYFDIQDFNNPPKAPKEISSMLDPLKSTIDSWLEQVDFCQFFYYDNAKVLQEARKLTVSFPHSNAAYCQTFKGENQECLQQGH